MPDLKTPDPSPSPSPVHSPRVRDDIPRPVPRRPTPQPTSPIPGHTHPIPTGDPQPTKGEPVPGHRHPIPGGQPIPTTREPVPKHRHPVDPVGPGVFQGVGFTPVRAFDPYGHRLVQPQFDKYGRKVSGFGKKITLEEKRGPFTHSLGDLQRTPEFQELKKKLRATEDEVAKARQEARDAIAKLGTSAGKEGEHVLDKQRIIQESKQRIAKQEAAFATERSALQDKLQSAQMKAALDLELAASKARMDAGREKDKLRSFLTNAQTQLIQQKDAEVDELRKKLERSRGEDTAETTARLKQLGEEIARVRQGAMDKLSSTQKQGMTALADERKLSAQKLTALESKLRAQFKTVHDKSAQTAEVLRKQLANVQARLQEQELKGISDKSAATVALSSREGALRTQLAQVEAARLDEERKKRVAEVRLRLAEKGKRAAQGQVGMLAKSLKATVAGETQRFEAQQAQHTKSQQEAIQAALNQQHVEFLKKMGDQERTSAARMQAVIDSAKRHQRETLQQSLAGAAKTHNLAAAKLQQQLKQSEARARKLGEQAKRVHEQMTQLADRESAMVQQHKSELAAVNQQLQVSDARIQASQEETKMQRMEFERNRDKMSTAAYERSVAMLEAKAKEHEEILKENTRNLEQNAQIMQREAANAAAWAAKEHSEKQQQLSNAMARQKQEMQTQMALKEAEHKQEMDASRAAMQLQQEFHDTSQSLRAEPANQAELAKMQHIVSNNIEFKRAGQQFEQEHRRFLNAPALRPPQMPVLVEEPVDIKQERPISPPSQLLGAPDLPGAVAELPAAKRFDF